MSTVQESSWPKGWIPSNSAQGELGDGEPGLLRMDNVTLEEHGTLRLVKGSDVESDAALTTVNSIFGAYIGGKKLRYVYQQNGNFLRNYGAGNALKTYDKTIATGGPAGVKAMFLNALGHVFMIAGSKKYKDDGTRDTTIGMSAPTAPTLTPHASPSIDLQNLDGSSHYTNWASLESSAFTNSGTTLQVSAATTSPYRAAWYTTFASDKDTTNLGGTGNDSDADVFTFNFKIDDVAQLAYVRIDFMCEANPTLNNYFFREWDFSGNPNPDSPYFPFPAASGATVSVQTVRKDFQRFGTDATKGWATIKSIRVTVGTYGSGASAAAIEWSGLTVIGGTTGELNGTYSYIVEEFDDTGQFIETSLPSTAVQADVYQSYIAVNRSGAAVNAKANGIRYYRATVNNNLPGQYLMVHQETGARGFTPASFNDQLSEDQAIASAAIDPSHFLEYYRTALPDDIIGAIWFRDRVIYLNSAGFFPSYLLDPGSYDYRFTYEVAGSSNEKCLFIVKLDVGNFLIATTKDFYRVTGTFITSTDAATGLTTQDVNIYPLGVTDPAINRAFLEYQGAIMYMSSTGIRTLINAQSTLVNGNLDLLFRGETRYGVPYVTLAPNDESMIACAASGDRIYWSLPCSDSNQHVFVMHSGTWRRYTDSTAANNPRCMFKEDDGTIIFGTKGSGSSYVRSMETATAALPVYVQTTYKYGTSYNTRKEAKILCLFINTGGTNMSLKVTGVDEANTPTSHTYTVNTASEQLIYIDIKADILVSLGYMLEIYGTTSTFALNYWILEYEARPVLVKRILLVAPSIQGKRGRRALTAWAFKVNALGATISAYVTSDGSLGAAQTFTGTGTQVFSWLSKDTTYAYAWEIELIGTKEFEFFEFLEPVFSQENPTPVKRIKTPYNAFGKAGRKCLSSWAVRINAMGGYVDCIVRADGFAVGATISFGGSDVIAVFIWENTTTTLAVAWEMELISDSGNKEFEFFEFLEPEWAQICPTPTFRAILPFAAYGNGGRTAIQTWPLRANAFTNTFDIKVIAEDGTVISNSFTGLGDQIHEYLWYSAAGLLAKLWQVEVIATGAFPIEFYEFMQPFIAQTCPVPTERVIYPYNNFGKDNRKRMEYWPFRINPLGATLVVNGSSDGSLGSQVMSGLPVDRIETLRWLNPTDMTGKDWQLEILGSGPFEFYDFMQPDFHEIMPPVSYAYKYPSTPNDTANLGKPNKKKLAAWPFTVNTLGNPITATVKADGQSVVGYVEDSISSNEVRTLFWRNVTDVAAVDWSIEIQCPAGMEFYKLHPPEILQIFPMEKRYDQVGPLDFNAQGLVFGMRLRVLPYGSSISYLVYDADTQVYAATITVAPGVDEAYIEVFPKGIDPAVCRIVLFSPVGYHRFSLEFKVRTTGKESEEKYIKVKDANSGS